MSVVVSDLPIKISEKEIKYDDFIVLLSQKAVLDDIHKTNIEFEGAEYFDKEDEKKLMEMDSLKSLFYSI